MNKNKRQETAIEVCHGPVCRDSGGATLAREFTNEGINVVAGNCRGLCTNAPVVHLDNSTIFEATSEKIQARFENITAKAPCSN